GGGRAAARGGAGGAGGAARAGVRDRPGGVRSLPRAPGARPHRTVGRDATTVPAPFTKISPRRCPWGEGEVGPRHSTCARAAQNVPSSDPTGLQPSGRTPSLLSALNTPRLRTTDRHTSIRTPKFASR